VSGQPGSAFRFGSVTAGEFTLDYAEAGPCDTPVTLVSLPGSAGLEMSTAKDILAQNWRVLEINPPGWGTKDDLHRPMEVSEIGELLAEAAAQLVDGPYHLLGTSMGGCNAIHAAASHPERVSGLILEGSMSPVAPQDLRMPAPAQVETDDGPNYPLPPVDPRKPWATEDYIRGQMENRMRMMSWVQPEFLPEAALKRITAERVPVLALLGDRDEILALSQEQTFQTYLPDAVFTPIAGGGHDLQNTAPHEFVSALRDFVVKTA
jgi:pimeloyl-ACP methyl ester carboxylesterase